MPFHNPYHNLNWDNPKVPSVSHAHLKSQKHLDNAYKEGIRHFAITNYHPSRLTYPLHDFFENEPNDAIGSPNTENYSTTNITNLHFNSLGSFWESGNGTGMSWQDSFDKTLSELQFEEGGGITINHPVWTGLSYETVLAMLDYDKRVLGIEVQNGSTGVRGDARNLWDKILSTGRVCFGFSVPDHAGGEGSWKGRNILLPNGLTEFDCLNSYRKGEFYLSDEGRTSYLHFISIEVVGNQITVKTNTTTNIKMITNLGVQTVQGTEKTFNIGSKVTYARFEASRGTDKIYSQPIMYKTREDIKRNVQKKNFIILN